MSYVVLARKYRPQNFEDVYGQEHITQTLSNAIKSGHIAHAYLFSGPRGVGKTTVARILAKMLNCTDENIPCEKCESCTEIMNHSSMDVIEIDGASNRGIDEIRDLRENVKFAPTKLKYKIYIIDEVHMLTEQAFNALLKTLEEPPKHVIFMFATTEIYKIPDTILSRCQKFNFKLIPSPTIQAKLKQLLDNEKIDYDDEALAIIARAGQGSLRDSLSLLDQIIAFTPEKITRESAEFILGIINSEILFSMVDNIITNNSKEILLNLEDILKQGYDIEQIAKELREHYRILMLLKIDNSLNEILNLSSENYEKYLEQSKKINLSKITRDVKIITKAIEEMKWSDYPRIVWEIALVKLSQSYVDAKELLEKLDKMDLDKIVLSSTNTTTPPTTRNVETNNNKKEETPKQTIKNEESEELKPEPVKHINTENIDELWSNILANLSKNNMHIASYLESCVDKNLVGNKLTLKFDKKFFADGITKNINVIDEVLSKLSDKKIKIECEIVKAAPQKKAKPKIIDTPAPESELKETSVKEEPAEYKSKNSRYRYTPDEVVEKEPVVQKILDMFGAEILPPR